MQTAMTAAMHRMSRVLWGLVIFVVLASALAGYAQEVPIVPYLSSGYRYLVVSEGGGPAGFQQPGFDDSSWLVGDAAFGSQFGSFPFCPLDPTARTEWPLETDILLRKTFTLPAGATNVRVAVAIDNDIQVFFNGVDISDGLQQSEGCAFHDAFVFPVPDELLVLGGPNLLAVRARDRGGISYVDLEVRFRPVTLPDELILTPPLDVNPVSTNHTVTATLLDGTGAPKSGVPVRFLVAGSVSTTGSCTTGPDGQCTFTYTGPPFPGADLITAYADQNNDTIQQPTEPADTATKAWEMPTSTAGHVTGGGHVLAPDPIDFDKFDEVAFGFNARSTATGFSGKCTVVDQSRATKTMLKCRDVTALVQTGNKATIFGNATVNDVQTTYRIDVEDNGEPGMGRDIFLIQTTSGYTAGGLLTRGNVQALQ